MPRRHIGYVEPESGEVHALPPPSALEKPVEEAPLIERLHRADV